MTQAVFDLFFGEAPNALVPHPRGATSEAAKVAHPDAKRAGWSGGHAPAIAAEAWPRSSTTGFPMVHLVTLELPPAYRRKGDELVGISLFQADDHVAIPTPGAEAALSRGETKDWGAFHASLVRAHANKHPEMVELRDLIGGGFALVWLRRAEIDGPRTAPPPDDRSTAAMVETGQNLNAWDHTAPAMTVWLVERPFDPNSGKAPIELDGNDDDDDDDDAAPPYVESEGYVDVVLSRVEKLKSFFDEVHGRSHLGGTCFPVQSMPEGLTPWFLELEDGVGGANFGSGNMQLDLESGVFDWAC